MEAEASHAVAPQDMGAVEAVAEHAQDGGPAVMSEEGYSFTAWLVYVDASIAKICSDFIGAGSHLVQMRFRTNKKTHPYFSF